MRGRLVASVAASVLAAISQVACVTEDVAHFCTRIEYRLPNGVKVGEAFGVTRRTVDAMRDSIVLDVLVRNPWPSVGVDEHRIVCRLKGQDFTLRESKGEYYGYGLFHGQRWKWSSWETTTHLGDGATLQSSTTAAENKDTHTSSTYWRVADKPLLILEEFARYVSPEEYRRQYRELGGVNASE